MLTLLVAIIIAFPVIILIFILRNNKIASLEEELFQEKDKYYNLYSQVKLHQTKHHKEIDK